MARLQNLRRTRLASSQPPHPTAYYYSTSPGSAAAGTQRPDVVFVDATPLAYRAHFGYRYGLASSPHGQNTTAIAGAMQLLLSYCAVRATTAACFRAIDMHDCAEAAHGRNLGLITWPWYLMARTAGARASAASMPRRSWGGGWRPSCRTRCSTAPSNALP
eukprot:SAG11_NODE_66_length_18786_cov_13.533255_5_plen_161_part_00